ncbi:MAG: hypothetical protein NZM12_01725 [Steroidobacteraceae bacterium]|nr:hypothetical protein [Steroidobacteraceae bacterium]MDW8259696.1 hypothetical protein [Gammaproteobacteria bacterium]
MLDTATELQSLLDRHPLDAKTVLARTAAVLATENRKNLLFLETLIKIKNLLTPAKVQIAKTLA